MKFFVHIVRFKPVQTQFIKFPEPRTEPIAQKSEPELDWTSATLWISVQVEE